MFLLASMPCRWCLEYVDGIPFRGVRLGPVLGSYIPISPESMNRGPSSTCQISSRSIHMKYKFYCNLIMNLSSLIVYCRVDFRLKKQNKIKKTRQTAVSRRVLLSITHCKNTFHRFEWIKKNNNHKKAPNYFRICENFSFFNSVLYLVFLFFLFLVF